MLRANIKKEVSWIKNFYLRKGPKWPIIAAGQQKSYIKPLYISKTYLKPIWNLYKTYIKPL